MAVRIIRTALPDGRARPPVNTAPAPLQGPHPFWGRESYQAATLPFRHVQQAGIDVRIDGSVPRPAVPDLSVPKIPSASKQSK